MTEDQIAQLSEQGAKAASLEKWDEAREFLLLKIEFDAKEAERAGAFQEVAIAEWMFLKARIGGSDA